MSPQSHQNAPLILRILARLGYAARGTIYLVIGSLALLQAIGEGGKSTDSKGAVKELLSVPFGVVLVWLLFGGLIGYSIWRLVQSLFNADNHKHNLKGYTIRGALLISALTHAALAYYAYSLVSSFGDGGSGGSSPSGIVSILLDLPGGFLIVAIIGITIVSAGIAHYYKAYRKTYEKHFEPHNLPIPQLTRICQIGLGARGTVFILIGILFLTASFRSNPSKAGGLEAAMQTLQSQALGNVLLGSLAIGLLFFATYSFTEACLRRIRSPES